MSSYNELIALINGCINRNGVQAITGRVLNGVLRAMVNQLGAGYAMGGVAHPTDDPGTPEAPVCYYASEVGTYTHFGNIQIVPGELALLCFDLTDGWFKETMYEGIESVQATIDGNVGTPAVNVTYVNGVLSFDFSNMKGNTGAAAGFGNVTAAVDGTSGTPGVSVQTDGPDTAKNIAFQFTGLKGETGVTSVIATVDNTSGTPQCAVSLNGQQLTLAFTGLKGAQGDTGSSVAYPFTIVNNLTTNDATQALSAAMGVQLESEVSQLEAKVSKNPVQITESGKYIPTDAGVGNSIGSPTNSAVWSYIRIPVSPGDVLVINGVGGNAPRLWCFVDANAKILSVADAGTTGENLSVKAPSNSAEVVINVLIASAGVSYYLPADSLVLRDDKLQEDLNALKERVQPLEEDVASLEDFTTNVVPENLFLLVDDYSSTTATSCEIQGDKITIVNNTGGNANAIINLPATIGNSYRLRFNPSVIPEGLNQTRLYVASGVFATLQQDETGYYYEFTAGFSSIEFQISVGWNNNTYILDDVTLVDLADQSGECLKSSRLDKVPYSKKESEALFGDGIKARNFPLYFVKDTIPFYLYADGLFDHKCSDKDIYVSSNYNNIFATADKNGKIKVDVISPISVPLEIPVRAATRRGKYNLTRMVYSSEKPSNPVSELNVLFMGDSYVSNKVLPDSFYEMLQEYGFTNVKDVGRQTTPAGTHFEANGGYAWQNYVDDPATLPPVFDQNYFWDSDINDISLIKYMDTYCDGANLDYIICNVLLNNVGNPPFVIPPEDVETKVRHFVDVVHTEYPDCKIILNGAHFGNPDILEPYQERRENVDELQAIYQDIANDFPFVYYLDVCCYFDGRSGMQTAERPVNPWSTEMETYITDTSHPNESGYKMIANADVQCFLYVLKQAQS